MIDLITLKKEAEAHLEVAFEVIDNALEWGERGKFEDLIGVSRGYLAELVRDKQPPSDQLAKKIIKKLPLSISLKQEVSENLRLAVEKSTAIRRIPADREWLEADAIGELTRCHLLAVESKNPTEASRYYHALHDLGQRLVAEFRNSRGLKKQPLLIARAHTLLHDALSVFDKPASAHFHAKMARYWLENMAEDNKTEVLEVHIGEERRREEIHSCDDLLINAIRSEAISYYSLGNYQKANILCNEALRLRGVEQNHVFWLPQILRDKMNAMSKLPQATVRELEETGFQARGQCEAGNNAIGLLLLHNSWARGYLIRDQYAKAHALLTTELERVDRIPGVGQYSKARLFSHLATLNRKQKNLFEWEYYLAQAMSIAEEAGLAGLYRELFQEHGNSKIYKNVVEHLSTGSRKASVT